MHLQRWLTAVIALPVLFLIIWKGGRAVFCAAVLLVNGLGQWEFLRMFQADGDAARRIKAVLLGSLVLLSYYPVTTSGFLPLLALAVGLFSFFAFYLMSYGLIEDLSRDLAVNALGLLYLPFLLGHLVWLRNLPDGQWWVLWLLLVMFAGDTCAFYVGRTFGRKKLFPEVSPGKTWAGTLGGWAASILAAVLLGSWLLPLFPLAGLAGLGAFLGLVGILGDLFESMLKRQAQVKDAGQLLPGHGGMLDRLDSILFAAPVVVYARLLFFKM